MTKQDGKISVRVSSEVRNDLIKLAEELGISFSSVIKMALVDFIKNSSK